MFNSRNFITILISMELVFLGLGFYLVGVAYFTADLSGQVYALCLLAVAAAESVIGLSLFLCLFRQTGSIEIPTHTYLRY